MRFWFPPLAGHSDRTPGIRTFNDVEFPCIQESPFTEAVHPNTVEVTIPAGPGLINYTDT